MARGGCGYGQGSGYEGVMFGGRWIERVVGRVAGCR